MPTSRRILTALGLTFFGALVGVGIALCTNEDRYWMLAVGTALALTGAAGLLLFFLAGPGGW
jgi:hypothetical protein